MTEAEVRGCLAANYIDSIASLDVPCFAYGLKYNISSAKQRVYKNGQDLSLVYLPDDPTSERGKPWLLK